MADIFVFVLALVAGAFFLLAWKWSRDAARDSQDAAQDWREASAEWRKASEMWRKIHHNARHKEADHARIQD